MTDYEAIRARLQRQVDEMSSGDQEQEQDRPSPFPQSILNSFDLTPLSEQLKVLREFDRNLAADYVHQINEIKEVLHLGGPLLDQNCQAHQAAAVESGLLRASSDDLPTLSQDSIHGHVGHTLSHDRKHEDATPTLTFPQSIATPIQGQHSQLPNEAIHNRIKTDIPHAVKNSQGDDFYYDRKGLCTTVSQTTGSSGKRIQISLNQEQKQFQQRMAKKVQQMNQERQQLQMMREDRLSTQYEQAVHRAKFKNRFFKPVVKAVDEVRLHFHVDWQWPVSSICNVKIMGNSQANRMPKNSLTLALPQLDKLPKRTVPRRSKHIIQLKFTETQCAVKGINSNHIIRAKQDIQKKQIKTINYNDELKAAQLLLSKQKIVLPFVDYAHSGFQQDFSLGQLKTLQEFVGSNKKSKIWRLLDVRFQGITSCDPGPVLPQLRILLLQHNQLKSVKQLDYASLIELNLGFNKITELTSTLPPQLRFLDLSRNFLTRFQKPNCPHLTRLSLDFNLLQRLSLSLPHLRQLSASNNKLYEADLSSCTILQRLQLSKNKLTRVELPLLVRSVDLSHNSLFKFKHDLPFTTYLDLSHNQLAELTIGLGNCLTTLRCSNNKLFQIQSGELHNLKRLDLSANKFTSFLPIYLLLQPTQQLQQLNYSSNLLRATRVLQFYQLLLMKRHNSLQLINLLKCSQKDYLKVRFGHLFMTESTPSPVPTISSFTSSLISEQSQRMMALPRTDPFFLSASLASYNAKYCVQIALATKNNLFFLTNNYLHQKQIFRIKYDRSIVLISRMVHRLRSLVQQKRLYFDSNRFKLMQSLRFLKSVKSEANRAKVLERLYQYSKFVAFIVKIQRYYRGRLSRKRFLSIKERYREQEGEDYMVFGDDDLQFFQHKKQIKPIKLQLPVGLFRPSPLSSSVVLEAERLVKRQADLHEYAPKPAVNNFILQQQEQEQIVESPSPKKPEPKKERQMIWSQNQKIDDLIAAKNRKILKMQQQTAKNKRFS